MSRFRSILGEECQGLVRSSLGEECQGLDQALERNVKV